jgi:hypothetical protein
MATESKVIRLAAVAGLVALAAFSGPVRGQSRLTEPVYRVSSEADVSGGASTSAQPVIQATIPTQPAVAQPPFDLTERPGEHPLAPVIRVCKASLQHVEQNVSDYSCNLVKQERLKGELGEPQYIMMKVRHQPFSVYMLFLKPHKDREVLFVDGQNDNELIVQEAGLLGFAGKLNIHPESTTAMNGQKYPITRVGIKNLLGELVRNFEADTKFLESEVQTDPNVEWNKRSCTMIKVTHPVPRQNFRSHIARIFFDNELRVPILYDAFMWPAKEGDEPPLEERYAYTNLKLNNGYTARDFDANGGLIFK